MDLRDELMAVREQLRELTQQETRILRALVDEERRRSKQIRREGRLVPCACGCGTMIEGVCKNGMPRRYAPGHYHPNGKIAP